MSKCLRHQKRKRPDSCDACKAELSIPVEKKSEVMVQACGTLQDIVDAVKAVEPVVDPILTAEKLLEEPGIELDLEEYRDFKNQELKNEVDALVKKKLKDVEKEINKMLSIKYESLDLPLTKFNMKILESLLSDGWKLITFLTKDVAKISGFKEDMVLLQRVRCDSWRKDLEATKLRFKEVVK